MKDISIIVPIYNAEDTIERLLASFISNKNYIKEVILVNDRSTDNTFEKIENFKSFFDIQVINNEGEKGPGPGRKTGLLKAKGKWVTFVDADDCLTPNSLYYVSKQLENEFIALLHTQTIYYESGSFEKEDIDFCDNSCGGNFYNREYLIQNNLFPHDTLFMGEDEYFNEIIINFINLCDLQGRENLIKYFEYPVYEVHHDNSKSFALNNWVDYAYDYHFLYKKYVIQFFKQYYPYTLTSLKTDFIEHIISMYFFILALEQDKDLKFQKKLDRFYEAIEFYIQNFNGSYKDLMSYYRKNPTIVNILKQGAIESTGIQIEIQEKQSFIDILDKTCNFKKFLI